MLRQIQVFSLILQLLISINISSAVKCLNTVKCNTLFSEGFLTSCTVYFFSLSKFSTSYFGLIAVCGTYLVGHHRILLDLPQLPRTHVPFTSWTDPWNGNMQRLPIFGCVGTPCHTYRANIHNAILLGSYLQLYHRERICSSIVSEVSRKNKKRRMLWA